MSLSFTSFLTPIETIILFQVLQIKNRSADQPYKVTGTLNVDAVLYTGKKRDNIKSNEFNRELPPNTIEFIRMEVTFDEYFTKLLDQAAFNISCMATVVGTNFDYFAQDDFRVRKPDIKIKLQGRPVVDRELDVIVRLTNPLPLPLRKAVFQLEGPGIEKQLVFKVARVEMTFTRTFLNSIPIRRWLMCRFPERRQLLLSTYHRTPDGAHFSRNSLRKNWMMLMDIWRLKCNHALKMCSSETVIIRHRIGTFGRTLFIKSRRIMSFPKFIKLFMFLYYK